MRWRSSLDLPLLLSASLLVLIALVVLHSALRGAESQAGVGNHLVRVALAGVVAWLAWRTDHRRVIRVAPLLFLVVLALSALASVAATLRAGTRRWIDIGALTLQPGELAKICLVLLAAHLVGRALYEPIRRRVLLAWAPLSWKKVTAFAALVAVIVPVVWFRGLHDYQRMRILSFMNPQDDPLGAGYQALQAQVAVGSGGLFGTGWLQGSQTAYQFLPAPHTDFVFAVLAEEFGFFGVFCVLVLYLVLGLRLIGIGVDAAAAKDPAGAMMVAGLFLMLFLQTIYNIAMVAGLVPIKGFPLPLMSYGGNSLLITGAALGLAASVRRHLFAG